MLSSIKATDMLLMCQVPLRPIDLMLRAAELSQGGTGWLPGASSSKIFELFCLISFI